MRSILEGSGLHRKYKTRLERLDSDKQFSGLLRTFINYGCKMFYNIGLGGQSFKTFYGRDLRICYKLKCLSLASLSSLV
jgi:hypothetical protein